MVEYVAILAVLAGGGLFAMKGLGGSLNGHARLQAEHLASLTAAPASGSPGATECTSGGCANGSTCFAAGTMVATPEGPEPIDQIRAGDVVLSHDEARGETVEALVSATFRTPAMPLLDVFVAGASEPLRVTPGHRFFTLDRGWIPTEELHAGEPLVDPTGASVAVERIAPEAEAATVYNFEVEGTHTYFVGDERVLVHNPVVFDPNPNSPDGRYSMEGQRIDLQHFDTPDPKTTAIVILSDDEPNQAGPLPSSATPDAVTAISAYGHLNANPGAKLVYWRNVDRNTFAGIKHLFLETHGRPGAVAFGAFRKSGNGYLPPEAQSGGNVAGWLKIHGYKPSEGSEILCGACNGATPTGPGPAGRSFAQALSDKLGVPVYAAGRHDDGRPVGPGSGNVMELPEHGYSVENTSLMGMFVQDGVFKKCTANAAPTTISPPAPPSP